MLPESYLVLLMPSHAYDTHWALEQGLYCGSHSGKRAVWVDCGLVNDLPDEAVQTLWDYHYQLQEQHMKLVVVHACEDVKRELLDWKLGPSMCFAHNMFDAAWQSSLRQME